MTYPVLTHAIMGFWRQGFNTLAIGRFLQYPEYEIERWLHAEMERRRGETEKTLEASSGPSQVDHGTA